MPSPVIRRAARPAALALAAAIAMAPLAACGGDDGDAASSTTIATTGAAPAPGQEAAAVALEQERAAIDVRTPEEYAEGHVEGAANLNIQDASFPDAIADLDPDGTYVVYCRSGNRSAQAAAEMTAIGLDVIDGGALTDMEAAGWPVT